MKSIDELIGLIAESEELARRLASVQERIGKLGAPELAELGGGEDFFVETNPVGVEGGHSYASDAALFFSPSAD